MNSYQLAQEFIGLRWGTRMPISVMVNSTFVQLRARGTFSAIVVDPTQLVAEEPDPENIASHLQSVAVNTITDILGELSMSASDVGQLTTVPAQVVETFQTQLESRFKAMGLQLKEARIEAIESL